MGHRMLLYHLQSSGCCMAEKHQPCMDPDCGSQLHRGGGAEWRAGLHLMSSPSGLYDHPCPTSAQQKYSSSPPLLPLSADYPPLQVSFAQCSNSFFRYVQMLPTLLYQKLNKKTDALWWKSEETLWVCLQMCSHVLQNRGALALSEGLL